ncbi:MAG: helix-turn-helix transcriptional regulator [Clostridia bacterium]|nr:helix-turn-helix transcriptional regulator [Clostridia bacterium]MBQ3763340.1 helix-turn-helix transcriptional regulator [Clostridia bacterium]
MLFGEKLRLARVNAHLTQAQLAQKLGIAKRTLEGYESGSFYPRKRKVYDELAELFQVDRNWFLTEDGDDAEESAKRDMDEVLRSVTALYSGGRLSENDKDALARALMDAYWTAKGKAISEKSDEGAEEEHV